MTEDFAAAALFELRAIRRLLEGQHKPALSRADRHTLARILPAIAGALGSALFTSRELLEHDSPALRLVLDGFNAKQIGRLLRRAEGYAVDRFMVQRAGVELNVILWQLVRVA